MSGNFYAQAQPFDCASKQQVAALAAAYPGALAGATGAVLVAANGAQIGESSAL